MGFSSGTSTRWLYVHCFQLELEFGVLVFVEGGKPENPEKSPRSRNENQQQTQSTCDARSGNRTRATAVGGERSHHCAIPVPRYNNSFCLQRRQCSYLGVLQVTELTIRETELITKRSNCTCLVRFRRKRTHPDESQPTYSKRQCGRTCFFIKVLRLLVVLFSVFRSR